MGFFTMLIVVGSNQPKQQAMASLCRVLAAAEASRRGLSLRTRFIPIPTTFRIPICNLSSSPNLLLSKLLQVPNSRIKSVLDTEEETLALTKHGFSWDSIVTHLSSSSPDKTQLVIEWRVEKMIEGNDRNPDRYAGLISLCGKIRNFRLAMDVFTSMEANGIELTSSVSNALINACLSSGNMATAVSLFEIMEHSESYKPNSDTYNAFLSAYANWGNEKAMEALWLAKKAAGFPADLETYETLILGCYRSRQFDFVVKFYEELVSNELIPNTLILEIMIKMYHGKKNGEKLKEFLNVILKRGWEINVNVANMIVRAYLELGTVEDMEQLLLTLQQSNQAVEVLSCVHYGLIRLYTMLDRLDDVEHSVGRMMKQGIFFKDSDDVEKVICSYFRRSEYERLDLFLEHIKGSYTLSLSAYDLLVAGYKRAGLSDKLGKVMEEVKLAGVL